MVGTLIFYFSKKSQNKHQITLKQAQTYMYKHTPEVLWYKCDIFFIEFEKKNQILQ